LQSSAANTDAEFQFGFRHYKIIVLSTPHMLKKTGKTQNFNLLFQADAMMEKLSVCPKKCPATW
jgi:hypothetical protein